MCCAIVAPSISKRNTWLRAGGGPCERCSSSAVKLLPSANLLIGTFGGGTRQLMNHTIVLHNTDIIRLISINHTGNQWKFIITK